METNVAGALGLLIDQGLGKEKYTFGELIELAERNRLSLGETVVAEAMIEGNLSYRDVSESIIRAFDHNLRALQVGLSHGESFLLGKVGTDLVAANKGGDRLIEDAFVNRALMYTLSTEVGNHEIGLQPCAGTGDSCPYTGLLKAMLESDFPRERVLEATALMLKLGTIFRVGKTTTGCNMEGFGAGAAATAAALVDLKDGSPRQVGKAVVLALSPTIAVPCTPRVSVPGLCATHISGAILIGNQAANLILQTTIPINVDVDVMLAMAAEIHQAAAAVITAINIQYLRPFFKTREDVESLIPESERAKERELSHSVIRDSRKRIRRLVSEASSILKPFGEVVVGGSSLAVGSPTNMGRIAHELFRGEIVEIEIELTLDLYARRAITLPGILMGAYYGAATNDAARYHRVMGDILEKKTPIRIKEVGQPEVQRILVRATERDAMVDTRNRGGGRLALVDARPSLDEAIDAARRLGIEIVS